MNEVGNNYSREFIPGQPIGLEVGALDLAGLDDLFASLEGFKSFTALPSKHHEDHPEIKYIVDLDHNPEPVLVNDKATQKRINAERVNPDGMLGIVNGKMIVTEKGKERLEKTVFRYKGKHITANQVLKGLNIPGGVKGLKTVTHEEFLEHYKAHLLGMQILQPKKKDKTNQTDHAKAEAGHNYKSTEKIKNKTERILLDKQENPSQFKLISLQMNKIAEDLWKVKEYNAKVSAEATQESVGLAKADASHHEKVVELNKDEQGKKTTSARQEQANMAPKKEIASSESSVEKSLEAEQHHVSPAPPQEP